MDEFFFAFYLIISGLFGLVVGSFLNVVIYRVPNNMSIAFPASHCPQCNSKLKWYHNIPVLSWVFLGGKCAFCKKPIPSRYTLVEILNAVLWILCFLAFGEALFTIAAMLFCSLLIAITFIDLEHMIIPDSLNIALAIVGLFAVIFGGNALQCVWWERLIGGVGTFILCYLIVIVSEKLLKKEAFGGGDVKMLAAAGLLLGWKLTLFAFFAAAIMGVLVIGIMMLLKRFDRENPFPFAPFLALGMLIAIFAGNAILGWYFGMFNVM